jgi:hypothetical protein
MGASRVSHPAFTGISRRHLHLLERDVRPDWHTGREGWLPARCGGRRQGIRLRTLADVFAYAAAEGVTLRLDATEIRVRRPRAGRPGRKAFVSGMMKQNTMKVTVVADEHGSTLWCGCGVPKRRHGD